MKDWVWNHPKKGPESPMQVKRGNEGKSKRKNTKQKSEPVSGHMSLWLANLTALRQLSSTDKLCSRCWRSFQLSHQYDWQLRKQADVRTGLVLAWILHNWAQTLSLTFYHRRWGINLVRPLSILRGEMNVMNVLSKSDLHYVRFSKTTCGDWMLQNRTVPRPVCEMAFQSLECVS